MVLACARAAMKRSASGGMALSFPATRYQEGMVLQAGGPEGATRDERRPIVGWLPQYDRSRLARDLLAGTVVAALAVPQALGYAGIAGVPVQVGLYSLPLALAVWPLAPARWLS